MKVSLSLWVILPDGTAEITWRGAADADPPGAAADPPGAPPPAGAGAAGAPGADWFWFCSWWILGVGAGASFSGDGVTIS